MDIPAGLTVTIEKLTMKIVGIDKDAVGGFAKDIRALKEPEPYKGKGKRYTKQLKNKTKG
jgi:large subunit ribosomal protein L6